MHFVKDPPPGYRPGGPLVVPDADIMTEEVPPVHHSAHKLRATVAPPPERVAEGSTDSVESSENQAPTLAEEES